MIYLNILINYYLTSPLVYQLVTAYGLGLDAVVSSHCECCMGPLKYVCH